MRGSSDARLTPFQEELIRTVIGPSGHILTSRFLQELRPCPILVEHSTGSAILRIARNAGGVRREASLFPALHSIGWPVPTVLAGPILDPLAPELFEVMVLERLPGESLLDWSQRGAEGLSLTVSLMAEAFRRFHGIGDSFANTLPRRSLQDEWHDILRRTNPWLMEPGIAPSKDLLEEEVEKVELPLMFSNGDFQPANFLSDGHQLTGMVDFEKAAMVDPLMVLARIPVYDVRPLSASRLIDALLAEFGFTNRDFALRVGLFALRTLQLKVPVQGGTIEQAAVRDRLLAVFHQSIELLQSSPNSRFPTLGERL